MARILVVGAGIVGKATGAGLLQHANEVTFVDVDKETIADLRQENYNAVHSDDLQLDSIDIVFVSVTTLTGVAGVNLTHLIQATQSIGIKLAATTERFPVIVYRSTMPPGTMRKVIIRLLEESSGKTCGKDFGVVYSPEYLRAASAREDFLHPRIITLASLDRDDRSYQIVSSLLKDFDAEQYWIPLEAAEFQKYVNNVGNAIKISTYNWFRQLGSTIGLEDSDIDQVFRLSVMSAEGLWNPTYGTRGFGPYNGACLPKDTQALLHFARGLDIDTALLQAAQDINRSITGETND